MASIHREIRIEQSPEIVWDALRQVGVNDRIDGYGRLLREF